MFKNRNIYDLIKNYVLKNRGEIFLVVLAGKMLSG